MHKAQKNFGYAVLKALQEQIVIVAGEFMRGHVLTPITVLAPRIVNENCGKAA
jgi:hypothetical protein